MGLKGYRLWAMGQLDSTCSTPPRETRGRTPPSGTSQWVQGALRQGVALQVAFERQTLKPGFSLDRL
jgi:hypothetical protein